MLQQLYRTRAAAYQEAVSSFVQGYREGFAGLPDTDDVMDESSSRSPDQARAQFARPKDQTESSAAGQKVTAKGNTLPGEANTDAGDSNSASHEILKPEQPATECDLDDAARKASSEQSTAGSAKAGLRHGASGQRKADAKQWGENN